MNTTYSDETTKIEIIQPQAPRSLSAPLVLPAHTASEPATRHALAVSQPALSGLCVHEQDERTLKYTLLALVIVGCLVMGGMMFFLAHTSLAH